MCHRTHVAIRAVLLDIKEFKSFVTGHAGAEHDEPAVNDFIASKILQIYEWEADQALQALTKLKEVDIQNQKHTLIRRWMQIRDMARQSEVSLIAQEPIKA